MKKSLALTLALVFVLGIAGTAFAATNPFVDVPADHWAYGAVKTLVNDGVIDGMGDGSFKGDENMTRYQMAQMVAKAMARSDKANAADKALIEKLQAEFATELDNLGVRVSNLEQRVGTIAISGDARMRYINAENSDNPSWGQRFRLNMKAQVNDNTSFFGKYVYLNTNQLGTSGAANDSNGLVANAAFTTKGLLHNTDITVGRYDLNLGQTTYFAGTTGMTDGIQANYKNGKASLMAGYAAIGGNAKWVGNDDKTFTAFGKVDNVGYAELNYAFSDKFKMNLSYIKNQSNNDNNDSIKVFGAGLNATVAPNLHFVMDYWKNTADYVKTADFDNGGSDPTAYVYQLQWKGNDKNVPGSFGVTLEYLKMAAGSVDSALSGAMVNVGGDKNAAGLVQGLKAWDLMVNYTLAKNITLDAIYQFNMKNAETGDDYDNGAGQSYTKFTRLQVNYFF